DFGVRIREIGPFGHERRWAHDAAGNVVRYHDFDGGKRSYEYTSWNLLSQKTNALGHSVSYRYTAHEKVAAVTDPGGTLSEYVYDRKDRLVEVRRHGVVRERYRYDAADNLIEKQAGDGKTRITYDIGPGNLRRCRKFASGD